LIQKLQELKELICTSGLSLVEGYTSAEELGQWILRDLTATFLKDHPDQV
jgi:hypothetical protein